MTDRARLVLVTGADGQLGRELQRAAWPTRWTVTALKRQDLDLGSTDSIARVIASKPWAAVINGAAYTAVDNAESDVIRAWEINALAPAALAAACVKANIPLIQLSTDYVFGGDKTGAWEINDPVGPLSVYGASKLGGELAVRTSGVRHVILRTAWVVSAHGSNFVKTMLRVGAERSHLRVVDDQHGSPTSAGDLAAALITIATRLVEDSKAPTGIYHFSNAGNVSWAGFASEIFRQSNARGGPKATVEPIGTSDYPTPAKRPANSLLSHNAIKTDFGINPRAWQLALSDILDELIGVPKEEQ